MKWRNWGININLSGIHALFGSSFVHHFGRDQDLQGVVNAHPLTSKGLIVDTP